jgi:hypothetical protein
VTEILLSPPWNPDEDGQYTLGPGATWERSMAHNIVLWQIPGEGVDGMDLWLDSDEIRVTWPWVQTNGALTLDPANVAAEFASYFITQRSEATEKNMFTLTYPLGVESGWVRNISFSGESGKGSMINCNLSFVVRHLV